MGQVGIQVVQDGAHTTEEVGGERCHPTGHKGRHQQTADSNGHLVDDEEGVDVVMGNVAGHRDITLPTKVRLVKAMVFPVVMY